MKITITGDAIVVTSAVKLEELKNVAKHAPKSLVLMGGEDGKQPVFAVSVAGSGNGSIGTMGASFAPTTNNADGYATITMIRSGDVNKDLVVEEYGAALANLNKVEEALPAVVKQIAENKKAIMDSISVQ